MTRVSIVIRSYNEERHIGRLLEEIAAQDVPFAYEVVVVDSGSDDRTVAIAAAHGARIVRIDPAAFTFGHALNRGITEAAGEFVVMVSAHCHPTDRRWLHELIAPFADPRIALVYGRQRADGRSKFSERRLFTQWFPDDSDLQQRLPFCNNANAAIRRSLWQGLPYDETLTGLEDLDWARRIVDRGCLLAYAASATVTHVHEETWTQVLRRYRREAMAFKRIYPAERFGAVEAIKLIALNVALDSIAAVREGALLRQVWSIAAFRSCQFGGTFLGYRAPAAITPALRARFYYPRRTAASRAASPDVSPRAIEVGQ